MSVITYIVKAMEKNKIFG